jgi:hypothetical protein
MGSPPFATSADDAPAAEAVAADPASATAVFFVCWHEHRARARLAQ